MIADGTTLAQPAPGAPSLGLEGGPTSSGPRRILVPLDLLPAGEVKLPIAEEQARAFDAQLILLHILPERTAGFEGSVTPEESRARAYLDAISLRLRTDGIQAQPLVRFGPVASTVVEVAREQQADLIIIGSNVRGGLSRLFPGAIADEIVHNAPCPVLLVRPALENAPAMPAVRSFADDAARAGPLAPRSLGARTVEIARIIGSVGRPAELSADFRPARRYKKDDERFRRLVEAFQRGVSLPPVELYKLGYGYYILDGHHRVAVAKQVGQQWIDALVTEFLPLTNPEAQRIFTERQRFERATGLNRIGAARPGNYARLEELIHEYADEHSIADLRDAARRWYAGVFRPVQVKVRALRLGEHFPGERTADVLLRVADHRRIESHRHKRLLDWDEALRSFASAPLPDATPAAVAT
jgi:nucleotide-binding universal stress UspA family protein